MAKATKKSLTLNDVLKNADIIILDNGNVISWFELTDENISENKVELYSGANQLEKVSLDRKVERTNESGVFNMLLGNSVRSFRPYLLEDTPL